MAKSIIPRFLRAGDNLYLMSTVVEGADIMEINGPYQCIGGADVKTPSDFVMALMRIGLQAESAGPVLQVSDLSEKLQAQVQKALDEVGSGE